MRKWSIILLSSLLCVWGCTSDLRFNNTLVNRLKDRGPVALSQNNPFLAGNLLLNREAETHPELQGFLAHRGIPAAIEVNRGFLAPLYITLYYPDAREIYSLAETQDAWVIEGPYSITPEKSQELARLDSALIKAELAVEEAPPAAYPPPAPEATSSPIPEVSAFNRDSASYSGQFKSFTPNPVAEPAAPQIASSPSFEKPGAGLAEGEKLLGSTDSSEQAEITPKGDLVHYVTYPGETLEMVAKWYTYDRRNAESLLRINRLKSKQLQLGDAIVVPKYLIKNKSRLTPDVVKMFTLMKQESK